LLGSPDGNDVVRWWTQPTSADVVFGTPMHGHIYAISPDQRLIPYEYRCGSVPKGVSCIKSSFYQEFIAYIVSHGLSSLLGLELLEDTQNRQQHLLEFIIAGEGTVMVNEKDVKNKDIFRTTGWSIEDDLDGIYNFKGNQSHAAPAGGKHQIFTDGKALHNTDGLVKVLQHVGVLSLGRGPCQDRTGPSKIRSEV